MTRSPSITLKQVASAAGVSAATVSRALRNHPGLPTSTCRRVQQKARTLGYDESPILSEAMRQVRARRRPTSEVMAFVTFDRTADEWRETGTYRLYFEGACARAATFGFRLEPFWARAPGMTNERVSRMLRTRAIRGVIVAPLPESRGEVAFDWAPFASAALGHSLVRPVLNRAVNHQYHAIALALREIERLGYGRVGLSVSDWFNARADYNWSAGYLVWQQRLPRRARLPIHTGDSWGEASFAIWVRRHAPEVVIGSGTHPLDWLRNMGLEVPGETGYANLDVQADEAETSGIVQNSTQVGAAAVDLVIEQLVRGERGVPPVHKTVLIEGDWRTGETLTGRSPCRSMEKPGNKVQDARVQAGNVS